MRWRSCATPDVVAEERRRKRRTDEGQEAHRRLLEDESGFIDFSGSMVIMTEEHVIFDHTT